MEESKVKMKDPIQLAYRNAVLIQENFIRKNDDLYQKVVRVLCESEDEPEEDAKFLEYMQTTPHDPNKEISLPILQREFTSALQHHLSLPIGAARRANANEARKKVERYLGVDKDGKTNSLLTTNTKLKKAGQAITTPEGDGIETTGMALAPAYEHGKFKMCPQFPIM